MHDMAEEYLLPHDAWNGVYTLPEPVAFPPLAYRQVSTPLTTPLRRINELDHLYDDGGGGTDRTTVATGDKPLRPDLVWGGSNALYCQVPFHRERCALFEGLFFPYRELPETSRFQARHGVLLWPLIQLYCFTQKSDPSQVYVSNEPRRLGSPWVARFRFLADRIELVEYVPPPPVGQSTTDRTMGSRSQPHAPPLPFAFE